MEILIKTVWLLLPAYTPNNFAVIFGGGKPIDFGKKFLDGRRILGDGKTWRGFFFGVLGGILVAHIQILLESSFGFRIYSSLSYFVFVQLVFMLSLGSMVGDSIGSFIKRRFGFERGRSFPILDQLTFLLFSLLLASMIDCFYRLFTLDVVITALILTPILHLFVNVLAYKLKLKDVWW